MRAWWLLATALIAAPAAAAEQFDLICKAKKTEMRYRIDLSKGEYCFGDCKVVRKIASVTAGTIIFDRNEPQSSKEDRRLDQVNRSTGEWFRTIISSRYGADEYRGACDLADFSGFPAPQF